MIAKGEELLDKLENQFNRLVSELEVFDTFYGDKDNLEVLAKIGYSTFANMQRSLIDSLIMVICRAYDPPRTGKHENLTLAQLGESLPAGEDRDRFIVLLSTQTNDIEKLIVLRK